MSDLIERDKVLDQLCLNHKDVIYIDKNECAKRIKAIPSARPQGEWIEIWSEDGTSTSAYCGECHRVNQRPLGNFCKWCGADMREREGER